MVARGSSDFAQWGPLPPTFVRPMSILLHTETDVLIISTTCAWDAFQIEIRNLLLLLKPSHRLSLRSFSTCYVKIKSTTLLETKLRALLPLEVRIWRRFKVWNRDGSRAVGFIAWEVGTVSQAKSSQAVPICMSSSDRDRREGRQLLHLYDSLSIQRTTFKDVCTAMETEEVSINGEQNKLYFQNLAT